MERQFILKIDLKFKPKIMLKNQKYVVTTVAQ